MLFADRVLPDLISAARASGDPTANAAADVLQDWSRNSDAADTGAILFERWYQVIWRIQPRRGVRPGVRSTRPFASSGQTHRP
jgi:hypothetical protein